MAASARELVFKNDSFHVSWKHGDSYVRFRNLTTGKSMGIMPGLSGLKFATGTISGFDAKAVRVDVKNTRAGAIWQFVWPDALVPGTDAVVRCTTRFELDRESSWIRKHATVELKKGAGKYLLKEVVIDGLDVKGLEAKQPFEDWQSYPVLCDAFFAGVEFPAAEARVVGDAARLACKPGIWLTRGQSYEVKPAIYGVTPSGKSRQAFETYVGTLRPASPPMHIQYNSWWSAPYPFTEKQMLDIIQAFQEKYYEPYKGELDSFCLDMGWAKSKSMWQIDYENFPLGFQPLTDALGKMKASLALWVSPSSHYPKPGGLDSEWARLQGYETFMSQQGRPRRFACLAGPRYSTAFKDALVEHTNNYHIAHYKFDGYTPMCPETDHGHEPGELSAEKMAEGFIATGVALRKANPDIWLEATCFGHRPSPWWLAYVNTVIGTFGSDAPRGRVPCPFYRDSATTGRDFYNLQGARDVLIPIYAQEVLGIIHQTPDPLQNDAVTCILRGHTFIPMYVNPKFMNDRRWRFLAGLTKWAKQNASLLAYAHALPLGDWGNDEKSRVWEKELPRDPYGYAHFHDGKGLLLLRNPWVSPRDVTLKLDESLGVDRTLKDAPTVCLYPKYGRFGGSYSYGDEIVVDLRPYETRLIAFGGYEDAPALDADASPVKVDDIRSQVDKATGKFQLAFEAVGDLKGRELWLLCESPSAFQEPACKIRVDGAQVESRTATSIGGWAASRHAPEEWTWIMANLPAGKCSVQVDGLVQEDVRFSAWLVMKEALSDDPKTSGPIPPPEECVLDAVEVLTPIELKGPPLDGINVAAAAQGAKASASSAWASDFTADMAIDGDAKTRWNSGHGQVRNSWLAVDFGQPRTVSTVTFTEAAGGRITDYKVQFWDGTDWRDSAMCKKPSNRVRVNTRFEPVTTRKIRLLIISATNVPTIYEIEAR